MRVAFAFSVLAGVSSLGLAQVDPAAKVDLNLRAMTADRAVAEVAKATGLKLGAASAIRNEVLLIDVKQMPVQSLLDTIASATSGRWATGSDNSLTLTPDQAKRQTEERASVTNKTAALRRGILKQQESRRKMAEAAAKRAGKDDEDGSMYAMPESTLAPLYLLMDLTPIARLRPNERVVYSTQPTGMQRALPPLAAQIVAKSVRDHNEALKGGGNAVPEIPPEYAAMMAVLQKQRDRERKPVVDVAKANLVISRRAYGSYSEQVLVYDSKGTVVMTFGDSILSSALSLDSFDMEAMMSAMDSDTPDDAKADDSEEPAKPAGPPIEYSEWTRQLRAAVPKSAMEEGMRTLGMTMPDDVRDRLARPNEVDPLAYAVSDELVGYAHSLGRNLVANLPDHLDMMGLGSGSVLTTDAVATALESDKALAVTDKDGTLLIQPTDPAEARVGRYDRESLAGLMQACLAKGVPSLDEVAAFAIRNPDPGVTGWMSSYTNYFMPGVKSNGFTQQNWEMLRTYGQLSGAARTGLAAGNAVGFGGLPRDPVQRLLFGTEANLTIGAPPDPFAMETMMAAAMSGDSDYREEPTEAMPTGLPAAGRLTLKVEEEPLFCPVEDGKTTMAQAYTIGPQELAMFQFLMADKSFKELQAYMPKLDKWRLGSRKVYTFTFHVAAGVQGTYTLYDQTIDPRGQVYSTEALPASALAQSNKYRDKLKNSPIATLLGGLGTQMGQAGGAKP